MILYMKGLELSLYSFVYLAFTKLSKTYRQHFGSAKNDRFAVSCLYYFSKNFDVKVRKRVNI